MSPTFGFPGWWACSKTILLNYLAIRASRDYFWEIQRGVEKINSTLKDIYRILYRISHALGPRAEAVI